MSDVIRSIAKFFAGGPPPTMNRREFLRSVGGAAASAAVPKLPGIEAPAAGAAVKFVDDPKMIHGFRDGLSSFGDMGYGGYWVDADYPEMEGLSHKQATAVIRRLNLERAAQAPQPLQEARPEGVSHYAWNRYSQQWHPAVRLPTDRPNVTRLRYLEPDSAIPPEALSPESFGDLAERWQGMEMGDTDFFQTPEAFGQHLMEDWRRHKLWDMRERGPSKEDLSQDPELLERYAQQAKRDGIAPGGRFEQQPPLDLAPRSPRTREFDLPLDPSVTPQEPQVNRQNFRRYLAPALLAPALTSPVDTDRR